MVGAVGARPTNSLTDLILSIELFSLLFLWLREWPNVKGRHELFVSYGLNLLGAACWCATGVYIHTWEPLPQDATISWQIFLNLGATTPWLFPLVIRDSFYRAEMSRSLARKQDIAAASFALLYALLVSTSFDFAMGKPLPPVAVTPWHFLDGSSYAGNPVGLDFDLLSVMPSARTDSQFVLSIVFMASNFLSGVLCVKACYKNKGVDGLEQRAARRLTVGVLSMLANCHFLAVLVGGRFASSTVSLDIFHVAQGIIIWISFHQLRLILREGHVARAGKVE